MAISFVDLVSDGTSTGPLDGDLVVGMPDYAPLDVIAVVFRTETVLGSRPFTSVPADWIPAGQVTIPSVGGDPDDAGMLRLYLKWADGTEGDDQTWTMIPPSIGDPEGSYEVTWAAAAWRGTAPGKYMVAINNTVTRVVSWTSPTFYTFTEAWAVSFWGHEGNVTSKDGGSTTRGIGVSALPGVFDRVIAAAGTSSGTTLTSSGPSVYAAISLGLRPLNSAPYAPDLTTMTGGESVGIESVNRARHTFSDPDADLPRPEGQSGFNIRYRPVGDISWTTINQPGNTNLYYDFPAATFDADDYERQVQSIDLAGATGPWSASGFFTAGHEPSPPTFIAPASGATVDAIEPVEWAAGSQDAYEIRRVADDSGDPNTDLIYWSSGAVEIAGERGPILVAFPVNGRTEHLQIRDRFNDIWSPWASEPVDVLYDVPPVPEFELVPDDDMALIHIPITTPVSTGDEPDTAYHNVYVDDGDWRGEKRYATNVAPNSTVTYWTPRSLLARSYAPPAVRVESVGTNGGVSST